MGFQLEILFIYLDCTTSIYRGAGYHLGSAYVQTYLRRRGVNTQQLLANPQMRLTRLVDMILEQQPRVVGFTCYDSNYHTSRLIAQSLKREQPATMVLMGGPSATFSDQLIMRDTPAVDACIRGEGEETMEEVVERLHQCSELTGIRGVTHRQGSRIVREAERPRRCGPVSGAELDIFPSPFMEGIFPPQELANLGISTSRGCPYHCIYCNFATMSGHRLRYHSVDRVTAELKLIDGAVSKRLAPGERLRVAIHDDAFTLNTKRAKQLCQCISELGLRHIGLGCETRADHVDRELLELMHQAGFEEINFGLESGVPRVLRVIKKVNSASATTNDLTAEKSFLQQTKQAVNWCRQVGINPTLSIISGLPTETLEEGLATLEFVKGSGVREYLHNQLRLHAGTELFERQTEYGVRAVPSAWGLPYDTTRPYDTRQIPISDSRKLCDVGNVIKLWHYFYHIQRLMATPIKGRDFSVQDILLQNVAVIGPELLHWLNGVIPPSAKLSVMNDDPAMLQRERSMQNMARAGSPLLRFTRLVPGAHWTNDLPEYVWQQGILPQAPYYQPHLHRFCFVPLSKLGELQDLKGSEDYPKRAIFLLVKGEEDALALIRLSQLIAQGGFSALPQGLTGAHCFFLNECCWQVKPCPAACLSRLIINDKGEVSPCLHGGTLGKVGDELADIRQNLLSFRRAQMSERGCHHCRVSHQCAKCLFPPLPADEFCRLKREQPAITTLIKLMPYVRSAWLHNTLPPPVKRAIFGQLGRQERDKLELLTRLVGMRA